MEQDEKSQTGAPSSDTTSALFVSARKKQIEQQETERRAKEKEDQRLAAEAEVRRLEREVEERRRKAEEDAAAQKRQAEEEARRIAEDARAKKAQAEANPDAVLGAAPAKPQGVKLPGVKLPGAASAPSVGPAVAAPSSGGVAVAQKAATRKKMLVIGGAVAAVLVIAVIIIAAMSGGGGGSKTSAGLGIDYMSSQKGLSFSYPKGWTVDDDSATSVTISNADLGAFIMLEDITAEINAYMSNGTDIITAAENTINLIAQGLTEGMPVSDFTPQLQKNGSYVTGSTSFTYDDGGTIVDVKITLDVLDERVIMCLLGTVDSKQAKKAASVSQEILDTVAVTTSGGSVSGGGQNGGQESNAPAGYAAYANTDRGLGFYYPKGWYMFEFPDGQSVAAVSPVAVSPKEISEQDPNHLVVIYNYSIEYADLVNNNADFELIVGSFANAVITGDLPLFDSDPENISLSQYDEYSDGSKDQGVSFTADGYACHAAVKAFANNTAYGIFAIGLDEQSFVDAVNTIIDTIVIAK